MALSTPVIVAANNLSLDLPVVSFSDEVSLFGDIEVVRGYRVGDEQRALNPYEYGERLLEHAKDRDAQLLTKNNDVGIVVRHGRHVLKYCWEAPALHEAVATEATRLGLENLASEGHGISVPRVIGGISSRTSGVLITEFVANYTPVREFDDLSRDALVHDRSRRKALYKRVTTSTGFNPPIDNLGRDDTEYNILWPTNFVAVKSRLPASMVRVDFGASARVLRDHIMWPGSS